MPPKDTERKQSNNDEGNVISGNSRMTLGFILSVGSILLPLLIACFGLYRQQIALQNSLSLVQQGIVEKFNRIDDRIMALQVQLNDRWTRSMMVLFTTELQLRNPTNLVVPKAEDIADRMPPSSFTLPPRGDK